MNQLTMWLSLECQFSKLQQRDDIPFSYFSQCAKVTNVALPNPAFFKNDCGTIVWWDGCETMIAVGHHFFIHVSCLLFLFKESGQQWNQRGYSVVNTAFCFCTVVDNKVLENKRFFVLVFIFLIFVFSIVPT